MAKKLRKAAKPVKATVEKPTPIKCRFGTPNEMGETHRFTTEAKAKARMTVELKAWTAWCQRHNNAGLEAISAALKQVDEMTFHKERERIECKFDTRYDVSLVIEHWRDDE